MQREIELIKKDNITDIKYSMRGNSNHGEYVYNNPERIVPAFYEICKSKNLCLIKNNEL